MKARILSIALLCSGLNSYAAAAVPGLIGTAGAASAALTATVLASCDAVKSFFVSKAPAAVAQVVAPAASVGFFARIGSTCWSGLSYGAKASKAGLLYGAGSMIALALYVYGKEYMKNRLVSGQEAEAAQVAAAQAAQVAAAEVAQVAKEVILPASASIARLLSGDTFKRSDLEAVIIELNPWMATKGNAIVQEKMNNYVTAIINSFNKYLPTINYNFTAKVA